VGLNKSFFSLKFAAYCVEFWWCNNEDGQHLENRVFRIMPIFSSLQKNTGRLRVLLLSFVHGREFKLERKIMSGKISFNIWLAVCVLLLVLAVPAAADTHYVSPGESIQAAIDAAVNGDEVVVADGTYAGAGDRLELVKHVNLWTGSPVRSPDTAGITYHPPSGHLLIADSEVSEYGNATDANGKRIFSGQNVFEVSLDLQTLFGAYFAESGPDCGAATEPVGIAYNPMDGYVYVTDDDCLKIYRYRFDESHKFGPPIAETSTSLDGRYTDPEGIACDPATGVLYVASGSKKERVLKFRFDTDAGLFVFLGEFSVADHIRDPEGIGIDPVTGNVFLVSGGGIAEFGKDGTFVQFFDYTFLNGTDVTYTLPGGLTFAPSSDTNDHPDNYSIYISCRGIDNGRFPEKNTLDGAVSELRLVRGRTQSNTICVPADHLTIHAAIKAASAGDTILLAKGTYAIESSLKVPKKLIIASNYINSKDDADIDETIIKASTDAIKQWFDIRPGAKNTKIIGLTVVGNKHHSLAIHNSYSEVLHCKFIGGMDQLSFEGGGGLISHCQFEGAGDDAIDADDSISWTVEYCTIKGSGDDGVEIRLHPKGGSVTTHILRYNTFIGNGRAGIQLIDYDGDSHREFEIYGNVFKDTQSTALDCTLNTGDGNVNGSPMVEKAMIYNNTFDGCQNGITMAPRLMIFNNIFTKTKTKGIVKGKYLKDGDSSIIDYCDFHDNAQDYDAGLSMGSSIFTFDPQYANLTSYEYELSAGSQAIDKGTATYKWQGVEVLKIPDLKYSGKAPDLGSKEYGKVKR